MDPKIIHVAMARKKAPGARLAKEEERVPLTRPWATLSQRERVNCIPSPSGRRIG
jgi:hypothetical protein